MTINFHEEVNHFNPVLLLEKIDKERFPNLYKNLTRKMWGEFCKHKWTKVVGEITEDMTLKKLKLAIYGSGGLARSYVKRFGSSPAFVGYIPSEQDITNGVNLDDVAQRVSLDDDIDKIIVASMYEEEILKGLKQRYSQERFIDIRKYIFEQVFVNNNPGHNNEFEHLLNQIVICRKNYLILLSDVPTFHIYQLASYVRRHFPTIKIVVLTIHRWQDVNDDFEEVFDYVIGVNSYGTMSMILKCLPKEVPVFSVGWPYTGVVVRLIRPDILFHCYDIYNTMENFSDPEEEAGFKEGELFLLSTPGVFTHHGNESKIIAHLSQKVTIKAKVKSLQGWVIKEDNLSKEYNKQSTWQLIYAGTVGNGDENCISPYHCFLNIFKTVVKNGIALTVYPHTCQNLDLSPYNELAKAYPNFKLKQTLPHSKVPQIINTFDFGLIAVGDGLKVHPFHFECQFPGRLYPFIQAGIPLIVTSNFFYLADLVIQYNLGIVISIDEINHLKGILDNIDKNTYTAMLQGINQFKKDYDIDKSIQFLKPYLWPAGMPENQGNNGLNEGHDATMQTV